MLDDAAFEGQDDADFDSILEIQRQATRIRREMEAWALSFAAQNRAENAQVPYPKPPVIQDTYSETPSVPIRHYQEEQSNDPPPLPPSVVTGPYCEYLLGYYLRGTPVPPGYEWHHYCIRKIVYDRTYPGGVLSNKRAYRVTFYGGYAETLIDPFWLDFTDDEVTDALNAMTVPPPGDLTTSSTMRVTLDLTMFRQRETHASPRLALGTEEDSEVGIDHICYEFI